MALVDATNTVKTTDAPVVTKPGVKSAATPNAEKLGAALDDIAGFAADARDAAEAKLNAAVTKDAPGEDLFGFFGFPPFMPNRFPLPLPPNHNTHA